VIFATVGTSGAGFARLMRALEALPAKELIVQHGPDAPPPCAAAYDFLPFGRIVELMRAADVVVSHAGVGSIMCALAAGHRPVVFPRLGRYGETVDDHQAQLAAALGRRGTVLVATDASELAAAVSAAPRRGAQASPHGGQLAAAVRSAIDGADPALLLGRHRGS
jgi:UDP-N-acetylglucosamine--N-acetylmuramyl-(pentapeptide) pyrophosphoryl-undecaprenol N-acetylglucosamine transferase